MLLAMALYETLLLRDVLRPLLGQLGARHRLPVAEIRAPISLRAKLVLFFSSVTIFTSGLVLLFALSPSHPLSKMLTSIGLALALALGLVVFIVRDMVTPVVRARGALGRDGARRAGASGAAGGRGRRDRPAVVRLRGDAARAARQAALDRVAQHRPRTRGAPPHRGARAAQPRAARRAGEAAARPGRSRSAPRSWPPWGASSPGSRTRSTTR